MIKAWEQESVADARTSFYRNTMHAKVIYHSDPFSLYTEKAPELDFWYYDGGGDRLAVLDHHPTQFHRHHHPDVPKDAVGQSDLVGDIDHVP